MKKSLCLVMLICLVSIGFSQNPIIPVGIGETLGDFQLKSLQGKSYNTEDLAGKKNIMLVFPRGMVVPNTWCPICYYQYEELAKLVKETNVKEKFDLEILYVLPYPKDSVMLWHDAAANGIASVERWKLHDNYDASSDAAKEWADYVRKFFPESFKLENGIMDLEIPVLIDGDKVVSRGLDLFTHNWGGTSIAQNKPTVFFIDKEGEIVFKYHSQYTNDRPPIDFLVKMMEVMF